MGVQEILGGYGVELSPEDLYPGGVNYGEMVFAEDSLIMQVGEIIIIYSLVYRKWSRGFWCAVMWAWGLVSPYTTPYTRGHIVLDWMHA